LVNSSIFCIVALDICGSSDAIFV